MKYLPVTADALFYGASAALLSFCALRYFEATVAIAAAVSILLALAVGLVVFLLESRTRTKKYLSAKQREECDAVLMHLALAPPEDVRSLLTAALHKEDRNAELKNEMLYVDGKPTELLFRMEPASADTLARLIQRRGAEFVLYCNKLSPSAEELVRRFPIEIVRGEEVYDLLSRTESIPEKLLGAAPPRKKHREKLRAIFKKSNARPFFVSGALLLTMSLFTIFPVWYLAAGSALLLLSAGLRLLALA